MSTQKKISLYKKRAKEMEEYLNKNLDYWGKFQNEFNLEVNGIFKDIMDFEPKGKATILHICDMHAHIKPMYWREPSTLISAPNLVGTPGFICSKVKLSPDK